MESHQNKISSVTEQMSLAIIAPDGKDGMINHSRECHEKNIPILFDPGQGLPMFNKEELNEFISQAKYIALNGYEAEMLMNVTGLDIKQLSAKVEALIITKGSQGSIIYTDQEISIAPVKVDAPIDPTGCGDAYRAGLVYGIVNELSWERTGRLASVMGAIKIQQRGGQNHRASLTEIESLFGEKLS
jgi:adenosine kinase